MTRIDEETWAIRLARSGDAEELPAIERAAGAMFAALDQFAWVARQVPLPPEKLRRFIARGHSLVANHKEKIVGFLVSEPFGADLHVREVSVLPDWQGRGIGAALLRGCMIDAGNSGFEALTLTTFGEVPWNAPFYRRLGFVDVDPAAHPRLAEELTRDEANGMSPDTRVAMRRSVG